MRDGKVEQHSVETDSKCLGQFLGSGGQVNTVPNDLLNDYELSIASRFWGIPPYELELRDDKRFWIARAITIKSAENLAEQIQADKAKKGKKG